MKNANWMWLQRTSERIHKLTVYLHDIVFYVELQILNVLRKFLFWLNFTDDFNHTVDIKFCDIHYYDCYNSVYYAKWFWFKTNTNQQRKSTDINCDSANLHSGFIYDWLRATDASQMNFNGVILSK